MSEQEINDKNMTVADDCVVSFHYRMCEVRDNGEKSDWVEQSFGKNPLLYLHGHDNVVPGLEAAMAGKKAGDELSITLEPEQAYGLRTPNSIQRVPVKHLHLRPGQKKVKAGEIVAIQTDKGIISALVVKAGRFTADVDTNHPYAGRTLHYDIEVVSVRQATSEEVAHRHVHGPDGHAHH